MSTRRTWIKKVRRGTAASTSAQARVRATRQATLALGRPRGQARVKGAIAPAGKELKYNDLVDANYAADTTGSITCLNLIATGDDNNTRDGRQVTIKSVQIRGIVTPVDTTTLPTNARVLLVWDNAPNGAAATIAQILTAVNSQSFPLVNNQNRFTILRDMQFPVGGMSDTATQTYTMSPTVHSVEAYMKIGQITQYSGTTANISSVQNGALWMVTVGDQVANAGANFRLATRVRFVDE